MRPAIHQGYLFFLPEPIIYIVAITLEVPPETFEHFFRSCPPAAFAVIVKYSILYRRVIDPVIPLVTLLFYIFVQYPDWSFIHLQVTLSEHQLFLFFKQGLEQTGYGILPAIDGISGYPDIFSCKPLYLAINRKVVNIFVDHYLCQ